MDENYIKTNIAKYKETLSRLPKLFTKQKRESERQIDLLCEKAGILDQVEKLRLSLDSYKAQLQTQADNLNGRIQQLIDIEKEFFTKRKEPSVKHQINLEELDPLTKMMVMDGNPETVKTLGGKLETSEDQKFHGQEEVLDWDFKAHWKTKVSRALELYEKDIGLFEKVYEQETESVKNQIDKVLAEFEDSLDDFSEDFSENSEEDMTREEVLEILRRADNAQLSPKQRERVNALRKQYGV